MLTGTIINTLAIVAGSLIGLAIQAVTKHSADDVSADSLSGRLQALVMRCKSLCIHDMASAAVSRGKIRW